MFKKYVHADEPYKLTEHRKKLNELVIEVNNRIPDKEFINIMNSFGEDAINYYTDWNFDTLSDKDIEDYILKTDSILKKYADHQ